jgi:ATP-dependent DNA helicase DinG
LEDVATDFFSISYSPKSIRGAHYSIYTPELEETMRYMHALVAGESPEAARSVEDYWSVFRDALKTADTESVALFATLERNVSNVLTSVECANGSMAEKAQAVYEEGTPLFYGAESAAVNVSKALARLTEAASGIVEVVNDRESLETVGVGGVVRAIRDTAAEVQAQFDFLISGTSGDHVFFAELKRENSARSGAPTLTALAAVPVDVSARLGNALEETNTAAILTSATLALEGDFSYTLERIGLSNSPRTGTRRFESPFDLDAKRTVFVAEYMPDPAHSTFLREAAAVIAESVFACRRRALVLCTSRAQVAALERLFARVVEGADLFVQSDGTSREDLLERFKRSDGGILVGLASFWEGVDLPGEELELLYILKLPFPVPGEPVIQARSRRITEEGENPFEKLFLPAAALKLRQGMGRLIRTSRDSGAVVILDRRLGRSHYGEFLLRTITKRYVRCNDRGDVIDCLERYFDEQ